MLFKPYIMPSRYFITEAFILRKKPYSEYHQIVSFFSPSMGLESASVKGSRKVESRYTGHLELLSRCKLQLYKKQDHFTIIQCQTLQSNKLFQQSLEHSSFAWLTAEMINIFGKTTHSTQEIYELIKETVTSLEKVPPFPTLARSFTLKILHLHGFLPDLQGCSECHNKTFHEEKYPFFFNGQHFLCNTCSLKMSTEEKEHSLPLHYKILQQLYELTFTPFSLLQVRSSSPYPDSSDKKISEIIHLFLEKTFEKKLVTEKLFTQAYF